MSSFQCINSLFIDWRRQAHLEISVYLGKKTLWCSFVVTNDRNPRSSDATRWEQKRFLWLCQLGKLEHHQKTEQASPSQEVCLKE